MKRLLAIDKPPTCAGEWLMLPGENEQPATVTDTDRAKARRYWLDARYADDVDGPEDVIAQAIADARAPFLALAEELEREGHDEEAQAQRLGKTTTAESWWGSGAASLDAAARIRRAAEADK